MAKNKKMTRNAYKRKVIAIGIMIFMSIALVTTAFASWFITSSAQEEVEGNISVGVVNSKYMIIEVTEQTGGSFLFEPLSDYDDDDYIYSTDGKYESLTYTVSGTISNPQFLKSYDIAGEQKQCIKIKLDLSAAPGIAKAAEANYIVLPDAAKATENEGFVLVPIDSYAEGAETASFSYTITFEWGSKFNGQNPSKYYNELIATDITKLNEAKTELSKFYQTMYDKLSESDFDPSVELGELAYTIIIMGELA